jgi:hypothetical protein
MFWMVVDGDSIQWIVDADNTISNQFWTLLDEVMGAAVNIL